MTNKEQTTFKEVKAGDYKNIDEYVKQLEEAGYEVEYENLWSGTTGFTAELKVNGETHAIFEGTPTGHLVKDVKNTLGGMTA